MLRTNASESGGGLWMQVDVGRLSPLHPNPPYCCNDMGLKRPLTKVDSSPIRRNHIAQAPCLGSTDSNPPIRAYLLPRFAPVQPLVWAAGTTVLNLTRHIRICNCTIVTHTCMSNL
jgi:hypothetical protein